MRSRSLLRVLVEANLGPRRRMADAIMKGLVRVNGVVVSDLRYAVDIDKDSVTVDGHVVDIKLKQFVYLMLNKPVGVLSTVSDERGRRTVIDILPAKFRDIGLYPVGRLDKDSTGLLLLTNDGDLANRLTHPRYGHEKEYRVKVITEPDEAQLTIWRRGVVLEDGYRTAPAKVFIESKSGKGSWLRIIMQEGR